MHAAILADRSRKPVRILLQDDASAYPYVPSAALDLRLSGYLATQGGRGPGLYRPRRIEEGRLSDARLALPPAAWGGMQNRPIRATFLRVCQFALAGGPAAAHVSTRHGSERSRGSDAAVAN